MWEQWWRPESALHVEHEVLRVLGLSSACSDALGELVARLQAMASAMTSQISGKRSSGDPRARRNVGPRSRLGQGPMALAEALRVLLR